MYSLRAAAIQQYLQGGERRDVGGHATNASHGGDLLLRCQLRHTAHQVAAIQPVGFIIGRKKMERFFFCSASFLNRLKSTPWHWKVRLRAVAGVQGRRAERVRSYPRNFA